MGSLFRCLFIFPSYGQFGKKGILESSGNQSSLLVEDRLLLVILRMEKWTSTSNKFDSSSFDGIMHNWKATMFCRVPKSRKVLRQSEKF